MHSFLAIMRCIILSVLRAKLSLKCLNAARSLDRSDNFVTRKARSHTDLILFGLKYHNNARSLDRSGDNDQEAAFSD